MSTGDCAVFLLLRLGGGGAGGGGGGGSEVGSEGEEGKRKTLAEIVNAEKS